MSRFRLTPQPGLVRVGKFVRTATTPIPPTQTARQVVVQQPANPSPVVRTTLAPPQPPAPDIPKPTVKRTNDIVRRAVIFNKQEQINQKISVETQQFKDRISTIHNVGRNRILVIIACGPSIKEVQLEKLVGHPKIDTISINKPDPRVYPTTYWLFCDQSQYQRNTDLFNAYQGTPINAMSVRAPHPKQILIRHLSGKGFSRNLPLGFYIGRSSTYASMQVAFWMKYEKIYILGCDMSAVNGQTHFYGVNPDVDANTRIQRFKKEAEHYLHGAQLLNPDERQKYIFCSAYNQFEFTNYFPRLHQSEAIDEILRQADQLKGLSNG